MIFLNGDNNLEPYGFTDFQEMAAIGSTEDVNILVQFDRSGRYHVTDPQWSGACRFRVERGMEAKPASAVEVLGNTNMGDGKTLTDFVGWCREKYSAEREMLAIWNHGQGWRFLEARLLEEDSPALPSLVAQKLEGRDFSVELARAEGRMSLAAGRPSPEATPRAIGLHQVVNGAVRYVSSDDTSQDHLFNREIQDALCSIDGVDLIGFDACLMSMVETAYALRDAAKVMVGSEELEPGNGWNYTDWLSVLTQNPDMSPEDLGKLLVDAYRREYEDVDGETTLSAVGLCGMNSLADAIDMLVDHLIDALEQGHLAEIRAARNACREYAPGYGLHGIDLGLLCQEMAGQVGHEGVRMAAESVGQELRNVVLASYAGLTRRRGFGSNGLSIYFPRTRALFDSDPDGDGYRQDNADYPVEFVQNRRWPAFLSAYYQHVV